MDWKKIAKIVDEIVPTLLLKDDGKINWGTEVEIELDGNPVEYYTYKGSFNYGKQKKLKEFIEAESHKYVTLNLGSETIERHLVLRDICSKWLEINSEILQDDWKEIIDFCDELTKKTYENFPVGSNFIIDPSTPPVGGHSLKNSIDGKLLDLLASSNYTYFLLDKSLNVHSYDCVNWGETTNKESYSSVPNFLQPYWNKVNNNKIGISVTRAGDIIFYANPSGLLASIRKGKWTIYENSCVKNMFCKCLHANITGTSYQVACNIFDAAWDLSYRRHGALIIVSDNDTYIDHVINQSSIISSIACEGIRSDLKRSFDSIQVNSFNKKSIILELASVDGSVVIDPNTGKIKSFGSIIQTHPGAGKGKGARTTAAKSAIMYDNMYPVKISSDGDITLYVKTTVKNTGIEKYLEFNFY